MILLTPSTNSHKSPYWKRCVFLPAADCELILLSITSKRCISSTNMICRFLEYYFLSNLILSFNPFVFLIIHLFLNNYFWQRSDFGCYSYDWLWSGFCFKFLFIIIQIFFHTLGFLNASFPIYLNWEVIMTISDI